MLYFIDLKGSITEGIFKKCANGQAYRTLRDELNSGEEVDWMTESPYVVATVLKVRKCLNSSVNRTEAIMMYLLYHDCSRTIIDQNI